MVHGTYTSDRAPQQQCPYVSNACTDYLKQARELSDSLVERISYHYCCGDFQACSRYRAVEDGRLDDRPDLAPWSVVKQA